MTEEPRAQGHQSEFTEDIAARICDALSDGRSLRSVCSDDGMPDKSTVFRWLAKYPSFRDQYARACEIRAHVYAEEILDIADDGVNDWIDREQGKDTIRVLDHEHVTRSRLRVDTRKWLLSKLQPKKYGDKAEPDSDIAVTVKIEGGLPDPEDGAK